MRFKPGFLILLGGIGLAATQFGCHRGASSASFLSLFGLSEKPVVVALVPNTGTLDPFAPHEKLRKAMSETIKRPVRLDLCFPIQLGPNLKLGFYDFALVSPACYAELSDRQSFEIVAASIDEEGHTGHSAVLVVAADSELKTIEDLRGKKVAFGPRDDARTHHAGLALLSENGVEKADLSLSLLPVPGSLKHFSKASDLGLAVQNGDFNAGFIDEAAFEQLQSSPTDQAVPDRDKLRVIARTAPVPEMLVIRSPKADPETVEMVTDFLLAAGQTHPEALRPLLCSAYQPPSNETCAWSERLAIPPEQTTDECK